MNFEEIYHRYAQRVFRVCMGYTNDKEQAKDLTQETFIAVWQNLHAFRHEASISTWIFRIATNNCLRAIEKTNRNTRTDLPYDMPDEPDVPQEEKLLYLYKCIAEMKETDRVIIALLLEGIPQAEIAVIVGLTEVNTRVKIHRIKEKLTEKFKRNGHLD